MAASRMDEVAQELLRRSRENKVNWEESGKRDSYRVFFPDVALVIARERTTISDGLDNRVISDGTIFQLDLMSEAGKIVHSLLPKSEEPPYQLLKEIFGLAESYVRDSSVDRALEYLKRA